MSQKDNKFKDWPTSILIIQSRDCYKDLSARNAKNRPTRDVPNASQFGTVPGNVKLATGPNTKKLATALPSK